MLSITECHHLRILMCCQLQNVINFLRDTRGRGIQSWEGISAELSYFWEYGDN